MHQQATHTHRSDTQPWYHYRWTWFLIAIPAVSIVVGGILLFAAFSNPHQVVIDNWYQEGRGINQSLALDQAARDLGITASLHYTTERQPEIRLEGRDEAALQLYVYHATNTARDFELLFLPSGDDRYHTDESGLGDMLDHPGNWYLELRDINDEWRLRKRLQTPAHTLEWQ